MANCKKATRGAMGHLMKHYERGKDDSGNYIKFGNQQIDPSRTHLNYNLAPEHNQLDFIHARLNEVKVLNRKDVNVMCSWVVTAPKELPEEHQKEFFERTYNFLRDRYSPDEKNVISAYVHLDEASPHMHFAFVPVVHDPKKDIDKVSAKDVITRTELKNFHKDFQQEMDKFVADYNHTFSCDVLNGATAGGNKTIEEYKADLLADLNQEETDRLNELMALAEKEIFRVDEASKRRLTILDDVLKLEKNRSTLLKELEGLDGKLKALEDNPKVIIQKFLEHPKIKPLFQQFCKAELGHNQERQEQRKSVLASLNAHQQDIDQKKKNPERQRTTVHKKSVER